MQTGEKWRRKKIQQGVSISVFKEANEPIRPSLTTHVVKFCLLSHICTFIKYPNIFNIVVSSVFFFFYFYLIILTSCLIILVSSMFFFPGL